MFRRKPKLSLIILQDPYKEKARDGIERFILYLKDAIDELENDGLQYDPEFLVYSVFTSCAYITICRKEDKTKSIPKKFEKALQGYIICREGTLVDTYKDIVNMYYGSCIGVSEN